LISRNAGSRPSAWRKVSKRGECDAARQTMAEGLFIACNVSRPLGHRLDLQMGPIEGRFRFNDELVFRRMPS
jgi:hypothetical protein